MVTKKVKARIEIDEDLSLGFLIRSGMSSIVVEGEIYLNLGGKYDGYLFVEQFEFTRQGLKTPKHKPESTKWFFQECEYEVLEVLK